MIEFCARAARRLQQWVCSLHGHDALLHFERGRMSLRCTNCLYESPGIQTGEHPPVPIRWRPYVRRMRPRRSA